MSTLSVSCCVSFRARSYARGMPLPAPRWGAVESVYAHGRAAGTEVAYGAARRSNCTRKCCLSTSSTSSSLQSARAARQSALLLGVGFRLWDVDCRVQTAGCRPEAAGFVILTSHTLALRHRSAFRNCPPPQLIACAVSAPSCACSSCSLHALLGDCKLSSPRLEPPSHPTPLAKRGP